MEPNPIVKDEAALEAEGTQEGRHPGDYGHLLCNSPRMSDILRVINQVAVSDVTVLITGESGTGKELVARTVHARSLRRHNPFIKVLCAALPDGLLESELFGYEKGAFTGAERRKLGKFEFANNGIIFLDEIGEIPLSLQAKLLQVLQDGVFCHIGGKTDVKVNVQVVAATNKILRKAMEEGSFREDLYYRLNVVNITLPPLRERREEIPFLVNFFLEKFNLRYNKRYSKLSADLIKRFMTYDWPGNIRELENLIKQIVVLEDEASVWEKMISSPPQERVMASQNQNPTMSAPPIQTSTNGLNSETGFPKYPSLKEVGKNASRKAEEELIRIVLHQTRWNRKKAARMLEISYKALLYKIKEYGLEVNDYQAPSV
ncbi:MAG TPA: sigma-54 dependent transcriptional regulator [Nitrospiria bacterium]|jgi:two-component system response regulator AtoC